MLNQTQKQITATLRKYWGYTSFLPLQEETILSILNGRDTLTMLATGGGKSLCFQLPALLEKGLAVVISPLISLMKDQVDSLKDMGIAAAVLNSSLSPEEQRSVVSGIQKGEVKLLYISPERLQKEGMVQLLKSVPLSFFVIDEAHCISHWGHDFREDYRSLGVIKEAFRPIAVHAFTATATREVQGDILAQLRLEDPETHIGPVDRPNLTYRVRPRSQIIAQVTDLLKKHANEPGIIYCLRRDDVDTLSAKLNDLGFRESSLPCRPCRRNPPASSGPVCPRRGGYHGGHHRLWHGHRPLQYTLHNPYGHAQKRRALSPGDRTGRPGRTARFLLYVLWGR